MTLDLRQEHGGGRVVGTLLRSPIGVKTSRIITTGNKIALSWTEVEIGLGMTLVAAWITSTGSASFVSASIIRLELENMKNNIISFILFLFAAPAKCGSPDKPEGVILEEMKPSDYKVGAKISYKCPPGKDDGEADDDNSGLFCLKRR